MPSQPTRRLALTRDISPAIEHCELTHLERTNIDLARARAEHDEYEAALRALGFEVKRLPSGPDMPDSVFIEDAAIVLDELTQPPCYTLLQQNQVEKLLQKGTHVRCTLGRDGSAHCFFLLLLLALSGISAALLCSSQKKDERDQIQRDITSKQPKTYALQALLRMRMCIYSRV